MLFPGLHYFVTLCGVLRVGGGVKHILKTLISCQSKGRKMKLKGRGFHPFPLCCYCFLSYLIQELDGPAKEAGVTLLNEIGLDPGIDHMLAMQCIDEVHDKGGKVMPTY